MPKTEKIGEDVLDSAPPSRMSEKRKRELEAKLREELAKKKAEEEAKKIAELEKLPKLPMPNEHPHGKKLGEGETWETIEEERKRKAKEKGKTVHVEEHYRRPPGEAKEDEE